MARIGGPDGFNAEDYDPNFSFEHLPAGDYTVIITDSKDVNNKSGVGSHLLLELEVIEGEYHGRKLWDRLNNNHPNSAAVDIANRKQSAICRAVGKLRVKDSFECHNIPLRARLIVTQDEKYGAQNEILKYLPVSGTPTPEAPAQPSPPTNGGGSKPW